MNKITLEIWTKITRSKNKKMPKFKNYNNKLNSKIMICNLLNLKKLKQNKNGTVYHKIMYNQFKQQTVYNRILMQSVLKLNNQRGLITNIKVQWENQTNIYKKKNNCKSKLKKKINKQNNYLQECKIYNK